MLAPLVLAVVATAACAAGFFVGSARTTDKIPAVFRYPSKTMPDDVEHRIDEPAALGEGFSKRTAMHPEIHNGFGMQNSRATWDGMLTLRVFLPGAGEACGGDVYTDDGKSYDFRKRAYLRLHITCSVAADGSLTVTIPKREGSFRPWWSAFRIEAVGFTPKTSQGNGKARWRRRRWVGQSMWPTQVRRRL